MFENALALILERREFFLQLVIEHVEISMAAMATAILAGGLIGVIISEYRRAAALVLGAVNFLYTIPSISMLGFLIILLGVGNSAAIAALSIYALLPMVRNTYTGLIQVERGVIEAAEALALTRRQILIYIKIPIALPIIMSGVRNMAIMTIALAGIASFIGAGGLGVAIYRGITTNNAAMTLAGSVIIALLALIVDSLIGFIENAGSFARKVAIGVAGLVVAYGVAGSFHGSARVIRVATKPMTEQYIMGEMLKLLIENDSALEVEIISGVGGGTSNIMPAMESGEFDIYPEYTGTAWNMVLKRGDIYDESKFGELSAAYHENYRMRWLGMYGFNNTYGLVVRRSIAERYGLRNLSDLGRASSQLTFGAEYDFFEREDGYEALCRAYGINFGRTMDLDIGLKYKALANEQIDSMIIFTTDGQLSQAEAVILADDRNFFPSYVCGNVVREEVLAANPELEEILQKLTGAVSDSEMARMNFLVEAEGIDAREVAGDFLRAKNLLNRVEK